MLLAVDHTTGTVKCDNLRCCFTTSCYFLDAISCCDQLLYPNIPAIVQLILTLPVGSCSCERSFSSLRRWNGLALPYVHDITPEPLQIFSAKMGHQ